MSYYTEEESESKNHLSTYQQYLSDQIDKEGFANSMKKEQDSSSEKSYNNKSLSLLKSCKSFDSNINNSFLCFTNEEEKNENIKLISDMQIIFQKQNNISIIKKPFISNDISLNSECSDSCDSLIMSHFSKIEKKEKIRAINNYLKFWFPKKQQSKKTINIFPYKGTNLFADIRKIRRYMMKKKKSLFREKRRKNVKKNLDNKTLKVIPNINYLSYLKKIMNTILAIKNDNNNEQNNLLKDYLNSSLINFKNIWLNDRIIINTKNSSNKFKYNYFINLSNRCILIKRKKYRNNTMLVNK